MDSTESDKIEMDKILYGTGVGLRDSNGEIKHIPLEDVYIMSNPNNQMQKDYNDAINYALSTDEPKVFLELWSYGEWDRLEDEFGYVVSNELRNPHLIFERNTMVTVTYSNGSTREFVASDDLEELINEGHMFSITTMHSDMGRAEEEVVSKMYAGNPITALGNMMMVHKNAMDLSDNDLDDEVKKVIVDILATCITLLSDEVTSHQSGMTPEDKPQLKLVEKSEHSLPFGVSTGGNCDATGEYCDRLEVTNRKYKKIVYHCTHPENTEEGKCLSTACPFSPEYIPF